MRAWYSGFVRKKDSRFKLEARTLLNIINLEQQPYFVIQWRSVYLLCLFIKIKLKFCLHFIFKDTRIKSVVTLRQYGSKLIIVRIKM